MTTKAKLQLVDDADYTALVYGYRECLALRPDLEPTLRGVILDTVQAPGSLMRAQLAFTIMIENGSRRSAAEAIAIAVEYFHTASLLLDDLPCMDNASTRRGRTCAHVRHGEAATILGALGLINRAYYLIWEVLRAKPPTIRQRAAQILDECLGVNGILDGQSRDIHFQRSARQADDVERAAIGKTVSLLRLTLVLPAIIAGVGPGTRKQLNRLATFWGLAYQIIDDFRDVLLRTEAAGKTTARDAALSRPNMLNAIGAEAAGERLCRLLDLGAETILRLPQNTNWDFLARLHSFWEQQAGKCVVRKAA